MARAVSARTAASRSGTGSVRSKTSLKTAPIVVDVRPKKAPKQPAAGSSVTMEATRSVRSDAKAKAKAKIGKAVTRVAAKPMSGKAPAPARPPARSTAAKGGEAPRGVGRPAAGKGAKAATAAPATAAPARGKATRSARAATRATAPSPAATPATAKPAARAAAKTGRPAVAMDGAGASRRLQPRAAPQRFTVSHLNEADFKSDGLRPYARYRDLRIAEATAGLCQAHVIRFVDPPSDLVRKRHSHATELQLVYVLKGWVKNEFEGVGEQMMSAGSCWIQPPGIPHTVLDYSPDVELLEIVVPADFGTTEL